MRRLLGTLALALAVLAPTSVAPVQADARANITYAHAAAAATDKARTAHDLSTLSHSDCLAHLAWAQAHRMAAQRRVFHQDMGVVLRTCDLGYAGENVAYGFRTGTSVVDDGWMKSPPHRANILSRHYRQMVIGAVRADDGRWYVSQVFGRHL